MTLMPVVTAAAACGPARVSLSDPSACATGNDIRTRLLQRLSHLPVALQAAQSLMMAKSVRMRLERSPTPSAVQGTSCLA